MTYRKRIIERKCECRTLDGEHFDDNTYIDVIFNEDKKPCFSYGIVGGLIDCSGNNPEYYVRLINGSLKKGEKPVTVEEVNKEVEKMIKEFKESLLKSTEESSGNQRWKFRR